LAKKEVFLLQQENGRAKLALPDKCCQYDAGNLRLLERLDDTAAQYMIVSIEDR
jgi:hypothetical protein